MYNKYFAMKRSELKEAIKAEIKSVLTENVNPDLERKIVNFVRKCAHEYGIPVYNAFLSIEAKMAEMKDFFGEGKYSLEEMTDEEREDKLQQAKRGGGKEKPLRKLAAIGKKEEEEYINYGSIKKLRPNPHSLNEEDEPTAADLKKADSVASAANKLQKLVKKMKDKAKDFKAAEGEAKEKIKDELKKMTAEKKKLEKSI